MQVGTMPVADLQTEMRCVPAWAVRSETADLSLREVLFLTGASFLLFLITVLLLGHFSSLVDTFGDSAAYMNIASAIRHWRFDGMVVKQFWGYPYAMAALSTLTGMPDRAALLVVSFFASLLSIVLAHRLWGGWVAAFFAVLNFDWMQRSFLGGSEPLFLALLFGAFLAVRRERWLWAALLASGATVVRPLGFPALVGVGLVLLWRREFLKLTGAVVIGAAVAALYALPLARHFGDPLATVHSYQSGWSGTWLFGIPFYAIIKGTILYPAPWTNLVLSFGWVVFVTAGVVAMLCTRTFRDYGKAHPVEVLFATFYLLLLYSYNYPVFARSNFVRFAIPIIPFVLLALEGWIPKHRAVLVTVGLVSPVLAAISALGLRNVLHLVQ